MKYHYLLTLLLFFITSCSESGEYSETLPENIQPYPENPHYLAWGDIPIFPLGPTDFHSWTPISRPENVDYIAMMDRLKDIIDQTGSPHVKGFMRALPYDPMNHLHDGDVQRILQPWLQLEDGRYDLSRFELQWEERLNSYLDAALSREIVISLEIWDDWSVTRGVGGGWDPGENAAWNSHPFNPANNINYDESVLPGTTSECNAPFYNTISTIDHNEPVLDLQKLYVNKLLEIAVNYPNVIFNLSNESRASLEWSRYWAEYIRDRIPDNFLIGDMPSTNRIDGGGECDYEYSPATLATDHRYDYIDVAQGVSAHEFGNNIKDQALGGATRMNDYRMAMAETVGPRPIVISKDYTRGQDGGEIILWSRFFGGAASARFHRPGGDDSTDLVDFQHATVARLGNFIAEVPFWNMNPAPEIFHSTDQTIGANILAENNGHVVIQLLDSKQGQRFSLNLSPGTWNTRWVDPSTGQVIDQSSITSNGEKFDIVIPVEMEHLVLHMKP